MFDDVELSWAGKTYTVPARRRMEAMARVEQVLTFGELARFLSERQEVPPYTTARAFGALLRFAGAKVTDGEVLRALFGGGGDGEAMAAAVNALVEMLAPPPIASEGDGNAAENPTAAE